MCDIRKDLYSILQSRIIDLIFPTIQTMLKSVPHNGSLLCSVPESISSHHKDKLTFKCYPYYSKLSFQITIPCQNQPQSITETLRTEKCYEIFLNIEILYLHHGPV